MEKRYEAFEFQDIAIEILRSYFRIGRVWISAFEKESPVKLTISLEPGRISCFGGVISSSYWDGKSALRIKQDNIMREIYWIYIAIFKSIRFYKCHKTRKEACKQRSNKVPF